MGAVDMLGVPLEVKDVVVWAADAKGPKLRIGVIIAVEADGLVVHCLNMKHRRGWLGPGRDFVKVAASRDALPPL
jgi:hypothetical protein